jgi:mannose-6-phosphate isomerase-like protein (cupin superfamily)
MSTQQPIRREQLLTASCTTTLGRIEVARVELGPGQETGAHFHPCPVVGVVLEGSIRFQVDGESARLFGAGDAFFEPANTRIVAFDNALEDVPATFVACYLQDNDEQRLIVMLDN